MLRYGVVEVESVWIGGIIRKVERHSCVEPARMPLCKTSEEVIAGQVEREEWMEPYRLLCASGSHAGLDKATAQTLEVKARTS